MNIVDKFGNIVGTEAMKDPEKARRLLLTGYRMQGEKAAAFPGPRTAGIRTVCGEDRYEEHH